MLFYFRAKGARTLAKNIASLIISFFLMYPAQAAQAGYVLMLFRAKGARTLAKTLLKGGLEAL